jgi:imidazoleglycerol phosphate dehydratase HisB
MTISLSALETAAREAHTMEVGYNQEFTCWCSPDVIMKLVMVARACIHKESCCGLEDHHKWCVANRELHEALKEIEP